MIRFSFLIYWNSKGKHKDRSCSDRRYHFVVYQTTPSMSKSYHIRYCKIKPESELPSMKQITTNIAPNKAFLLRLDVSIGPVLTTPLAGVRWLRFLSPS